MITVASESDDDEFSSDEEADPPPPVWYTLHLLSPCVTYLCVGETSTNTVLSPTIKLPSLSWCATDEACCHCECACYVCVCVCVCGSTAITHCVYCSLLQPRDTRRPQPPPPAKQQVSSKEQASSTPLLESGGVWSWVVWLFWLLLTMTVAFVAGYVIFDVYLRGWGDSHVMSVISPYLPKATAGSNTGPTGGPK